MARFSLLRCIACISALGLATGGTFAASSTAAATTTPSKPPAQAHIPHDIAGRVVSFDAKTGALVVQPHQGPAVTVTLDSQTSVMAGDQPGSRDNLKPDAFVLVSSRQQNGRRIAATVTIRTGHVTGAAAPAAGSSHS